MQQYLSKLLLCLVLILCLPQIVYSQCGLIDDYCYDDNEVQGENLVTICPDEGNILQFEIINLELYVGDVFYLYDGEDETAPLLAQLEGENIGTSGQFFSSNFTSSNPNTCITFDFSSNFVVSCIQSGIGGAVSPLLYQVDCICPSATAEFIVDPSQACSNESILQGTEIVFDATASTPFNNDFEITEYFWDFGDGTTGMGISPNHIYQESGAYLVSLQVLQNNDCLSYKTYELVQVSGPPSIDITEINGFLCDGQQIALTYTFEEFIWSPSNAPNLSVVQETNDTGIIDTIEISNALADLITNETEITVNIEIAHEWLTDIQMTLTCPNGTEVYLLNFPNFDQSNNLTGETYSFKINAAQTVAEVIPTLEIDDDLLPGSYLPFESFENFINCSFNGAWILQIFDTFTGGEPITLNSWSIEFTSQAEGFSVPIASHYWTGNGIDSTGLLIAPDTSGMQNYTIHLIDDWGCEYTEETLVEFLVCDCPETNTPDSESNVCINETIDLAALTESIDLNVMTEYPIQFFFDKDSDGQPINEYLGEPLSSLLEIGCAPIEVPLFAFINCNSDGDPNTAPIYHDLNFEHHLICYPNELPSTLELVYEPNGCEMTYTVEPNCQDLIIANLETPLNFIPNETGIACLSFAYTNYPPEVISCAQSVEICMEYNCAPTCPTEVINPLEVEEVTFYEPTVINLNTLAEMVQTDIEDFAVYTWTDLDGNVIEDPTAVELNYANSTDEVFVFNFILEIDCINNPDLNLAGGVYLVVLNQPLGIESVRQTNIDFSIYPNPSQEVLNLSPIQGNYFIEIFNTKGALLMEFQNESSLNISQLPQGTYFIKVKTKDGTFSKKWAKLN